MYLRNLYVNLTSENILHLEHKSDFVMRIEELLVDGVDNAWENTGRSWKTVYSRNSHSSILMLHAFTERVIPVKSVANSRMQHR